MKRIVQIGTERGDDHVYEMISKSTEPVFAIFVEPNPFCLEIIRNRYKFLETKIISNIAISDKNGVSTMHFPPWFSSGESAVASLRSNHLVNHGINEGSIVKIDILSFQINSYLNSLMGIGPNEVIDNLFIDTEGFDCDILLSTNFDQLKIKNICFEYIHSDERHIIEESGGPLNTPKFKSTHAYLEQNGFVQTLVDPDSHNVFYQNTKF